MRTYILLIAILFGFSVQAQHTIVLKSGEKIDGIVMSLNHDVWEVVVNNNIQKIQMKDVTSIFFKEHVPYDGAFVADGEEKVLKVDGFTVKYQIKGREMIRLPKVSIGSEDKGTVVVKISVDRYGNIEKAEPGAPGSTTSNAYLYAKAKAAAQSAQFDKDLKGPLSTEGIITIIY